MLVETRVFLGLIKRMYVFISEYHILDWHSYQICYPLEIKLLLLSLLLNILILIIIIIITTDRASLTFIRFWQSLDRDKWHLTIPLARSSQYQ